MTETAQKEKTTQNLKMIMAKKVGMTQVYDDSGLARPATELQAGPCYVVSLKTKEKDGYAALVVGFDPVKEKGLNRAQIGIFKKAGVQPCYYLKEIRVPDVVSWKPGDVIGIEGMFKPGDYVDVSGRSKGKGFAGGVKRWNFRGGPKTHGQSDRHRAPGSLAGRRSLGRVLPGKKMAGHLGAEEVVVQKMEVLKINGQEHRIFVEGGVPGTKGSLVWVYETVNRRKHRIDAVALAAKMTKKKQAPTKSQQAAAKKGK